MKQIQILGVGTDKKPGMILAEIARKTGVSMVLVAEGLAAKTMKEAGIELSYEGPSKAGTPWNIDPKLILQNLQIDVVVSGLSTASRALEGLFKKAAVELGIPAILLDDDWGSYARTSLRPDEVAKVLTIDPLGQELLHQHGYSDEQVTVIGDLSAGMALVPPPEAIVQAIEKVRKRADHVFLVATQKWPESTEILNVALNSCARSIRRGERIVVIPRFHPNASENDKEIWREQIGIFEKEFPGSVEWAGNISAEHLAELADGTFAAVGSALRTAAAARKMPICVSGSLLAPKILNETGMEKNPLTIVGAGIELNEPTDIVALVGERGETVRTVQGQIICPVAFDAEKALLEILSAVRDPVVAGSAV